jgi:hypothetical protein
MNFREKPLPAQKVCSHCLDPDVIGWLWSVEQGYVGWCREHVDRQTIELNERTIEVNDD